jgi:Zn ribbon nucleic-acid-binding protein
MPSYRVGKSSSTKRRVDLVRRLKSQGLVAMVACSRCEAAYTLYVFVESALKCIECVRKGCGCDGNFFSEDFNRIKKEKKKLKVALYTTLECF